MLCLPDWLWRLWSLKFIFRQKISRFETIDSKTKSVDTGKIRTVGLSTGMRTIGVKYD